MADEILPPVEIPAVAPAPEPVVVPVAEPVVEPNTPAPESVPAETSLLGEDAAPAEPIAPEPKPDDAPADEPKEGDATVETKEGEGSQSDEPAPLPTYEAFTLPDGAVIDNEVLGEFTKDLGELQNLTKADQAEMQKFGQKLVDRHTAAIDETVKRLTDHYTETWEKQKTDWKDAFEKDPDIGGNRRDTTLKSALSVIGTYGGTTDQQKELRTLLNDTGIGNNPAVIRLLAKVGEQLVEGKPLPASAPVKGSQSKVAKRYGTT